MAPIETSAATNDGAALPPPQLPPRARSMPPASPVRRLAPLPLLPTPLPRPLLNLELSAEKVVAGAVAASAALMAGAASGKGDTAVAAGAALAVGAIGAAGAVEAADDLAGEVD